MVNFRLLRDVEMCLETITGKGYEIGEDIHPGWRQPLIPLQQLVAWGVRRARNVFLSTAVLAGADDLDGQHCRHRRRLLLLLHVANNRQVRTLLTPGKEKHS